MQKSIREIIYSLRDVLTGRNGKGDGISSEFIGSVFFSFIAALLTAVNVIKHVQPVMTIATTVLIAGFAAAALLSYRQKLEPARLLIILLCGVLFTAFALIGGNDGFAILWILLVPVIGSIWIGLRGGVILSIYFQLFLIVLFYTPLRNLVKDYYSATFMLRFPLLYLASFGSVSFIMWQREALSKKLHVAAYYDALTGLPNRRYWDERGTEIKSAPLNPCLAVFSFDLNRLKYANDTFGHQAGDELIRAAADIIRRNFRDAECFRTGGDEFTAYAVDEYPQASIAAMKRNAAEWKGQYMQEIGISVGYASAMENPELSLDELLMLADQRMYEDKSSYYETSGLDRRRK